MGGDLDAGQHSNERGLTLGPTNLAHTLWWGCAPGRRHSPRSVRPIGHMETPELADWRPVRPS